MYKTLKLTKKTASELIGQICPRLNINKDNTPPEVAIFRATTGPKGLEIKCENDWYNHDGRIKLTICDGTTWIIRYYHPETLERDFAAEDAEKEDADKESRVRWVFDIGQEMAHKMVDQYWEEG